MPGAIHADVVERLRKRALRGNLPSILVLPSAVRGSRVYYSEFDMLAVKNAVDAGVDADFLDSLEDRRYLSEYSTSVVFAIAISVMQDLTVEGLKVVGTFLLARIKNAVAEGLAKDRNEPDLRIDVASIRMKAGEVEIEDLHVAARGEQAIAVLLPLLGGRLAASVALEELGIPSTGSEVSESDQSGSGSRCE